MQFRCRANNNDSVKKANLVRGAPKKHMQQAHNANSMREKLVNNTKIIRKEHNVKKLEMLDSSLIHKNDSHINKQDKGKHSY